MRIAVIIVRRQPAILHDFQHIVLDFGLRHDLMHLDRFPDDLTDRQTRG